jgi:hypothetical protein
MALRVTAGRILDRAADQIGPDAIGPDVAELAQRRDDLVWREPPRERARVKVGDLLGRPRDVFHWYKVIESRHFQPLDGDATIPDSHSRNRVSRGAGAGSGLKM